MGSFFVFAPYFLVPLFVTLLIRRISVSGKGFTYVLTGVIIFFYPQFLFFLADYFNPPLRERPQCGLPQVAVMIGNAMVFLPISLFLQFLFNKELMKVEREGGEPSAPETHAETHRIDD